MTLEDSQTTPASQTADSLELANNDSNDANTGYRLPPTEVVQIIDTKPTPALSLSPDRKYMILTEYEPYPPIEMLSRPYLKLAGLRVDPTLPGEQRTTRFGAMSILRLADGTRTPVLGLPDGAETDSPDISPDSKRFAFSLDTLDGITIWVGDVETGHCHELPDVRVSDVLADGFDWMDDSRHLLVNLVPTNRQAAPEISRVPTGPVIEETSGKFTKAATYQDLLQNETDERLFDHYGTTQLARVDVETGAITLLGEPCLLVGSAPSPDNRYLLVQRLRRPFSYRVPYHLFARVTEVWDAQTGRHLHTVADLPVSDEVPPQGVPTGPRGIGWQELKPATLLWTEALDGGDPLAKVPHRDRLMRQDAPFSDAMQGMANTNEPTEVLRVTHRMAGLDWFAQPDEVFLTEYDRDRRWRTTYQLNLADPKTNTEWRTIFDLSVNDAYGDPGSPLYHVKPNGDRVLLQDGDYLYLSGRGATEEGDRPFLDKFHIQTHATERLFQCGDDGYEAFHTFVNIEPDGNRDELLISRQSPTEPMNYHILNRVTQARRVLTDFPDPHPQITGLKKELVRYQRKDGTPLSGTLYLPPNYDPQSGERLPLLLWAYPLEYSDAGTAGQVRGSTQTFTRLAGTSPLWFVLRGYAVLNDATMPVVGDPETMNDTFVEQVTGAAKAAIDTLSERGLVDPRRVLVAGHSYGAFMTAHLLAHTDLFAAGIARSGAYNRTLTPFGFQSERRSYWEAKDIYHTLSPFTWANQISAPLLLIHGQDDSNSGTHTLQSERFFQALQAHGATARLVLLPYESHGYRARESVLHVLAEMFEWADRYVKNRPEESDTQEIEGT